MDSLNGTSNLLVSHMQQYANNLLFNNKPISDNNYQIYTSTPINNQPTVFLTPNNNTQILFSNNYVNPIENYIISNDLSINQSNQQLIKPINQNVMQQSSSKLLINNNNSSIGYHSKSSSYLSNATLSSCYETRSSGSDINNYTSKTLSKSTNRILPIRSEAIDMAQDIKNAKLLKQTRNKNIYCSFCKNNNETEQVYSSHLLKDTNGKITCPILRCHKCPICGESGDNAHTLTYCKDFKKSKRIQALQKALAQI